MASGKETEQEELGIYKDYIDKLFEIVAKKAEEQQLKRYVPTCDSSAPLNSETDVVKRAYVIQQAKAPKKSTCMCFLMGDCCGEGVDVAGILGAVGKMTTDIISASAKAASEVIPPIAKGIGEVIPPIAKGLGNVIHDILDHGKHNPKPPPPPDGHYEWINGQWVWVKGPPSQPTQPTQPKGHYVWTGGKYVWVQG